MHPTLIRKFSTLVLIGLISVFVYGQQPNPEDATINSMRATVQRLVDLSSDPNIPTESKNQINDLLFEKRAELHALLRKKREALEANLKSGSSSPNLQAIPGLIQQLNDEMLRLRSGTPDTRGPETVTVIVPNNSKNPEPGPAPETKAPGGSKPDGQVDPAAQPAPQQPVVLDSRCDNFPVAKPKKIEEHYRLIIRHDICTILRDRANKQSGQLTFLANNELILDAILSQAASNGKKTAVADLTAQAENASNSKQVGGNESNGGSTSLVTKAGLPAIFGLAVENGALTKTTSGSTVTFTGTPVGIVQAMAKKGFIDSFQDQADFTAFLRRLSFGVSFDTSRGNPAGTTSFTGNKKQISGYSLKYSLVDQRDPRLKKYTKEWEDLTSEQAANVAAALNDFVKSLRKTPERAPGLVAWLNETNAALKSVMTYDEIQSTLVAQLNKLGNIEVNWPPEEKALVDTVGTKFDAYLKRKNEILGEIANGWLATFEYNNSRPIGTPSLSNFRFLGEKGSYNGSIDFTGNASFTIYNSSPVGAKSGRLRDFRLAGQLDVPLGEISKTGKFLLSFAGRYERLLNDEPIAGSTTVIKKGDIAVGQLKLTIPIRGTALKIPLSLSFANRTELIKEKEVRGNFGITFDLDSIFAKFNPFTQKQ